MRFECYEDEGGAAGASLDAFGCWRAYARFMAYLEGARHAAPGTLGEYAGVAAWVARHHCCPADVPPSQRRAHPLVRRYMDWRNEWQARAERARRAVDADELAERGRWLPWPRFQACVRRLRAAWDAAQGEEGAGVTRERARQLHGEACHPPRSPVSGPWRVASLPCACAHTPTHTRTRATQTCCC